MSSKSLIGPTAYMVKGLTDEKLENIRLEGWPTNSITTAHRAFQVQNWHEFKFQSAKQLAPLTCLATHIVTW